MGYTRMADEPFDLHANPLPALVIKEMPDLSSEHVRIRQVQAPKRHAMIGSRASHLPEVERKGHAGSARNVDR